MFDSNETVPGVCFELALVKVLPNVSQETMARRVPQREDGAVAIRVVALGGEADRKSQ